MSLDKATINDYVKDLTVVSPSRDRKRINFELTLQTSDDEKRVVRFNPKNQKRMNFFVPQYDVNSCTVLVGSSKRQLIAPPRLLVEAFKPPISEKLKLSKSMLKSS